MAQALTFGPSWVPTCVLVPVYRQDGTEKEWEQILQFAE